MMCKVLIRFASAETDTFVASVSSANLAGLCQGASKFCLAWDTTFESIVLHTGDAAVPTTH